MRQGSSGRRPRGRPHRKQHLSPRSQTFDSSGPEGRVRGNAHQVYEKYLALARDATASGDRIAAEGFYQFAEHYYRVVNDSTDPNSEGSSRRFDQRRDQGTGEQPDIQPPASQGAGRGERQPTNGAARSDGTPVDAGQAEGAKVDGEATEAPASAIAVGDGEEQPEVKAAPKRRAPRRRKAPAGNGAAPAEPEAKSKEAAGDDGETEPVTP